MMKPGETSAAATSAERRLRRWLLGLLPPLVALALQLALGSYFQPSVWFLFYSAVFLSSWIGGLSVGIVATTASAATVLWLFLPPEQSWLKPAGQYFTAAAFFTTGVMFGVFHELFRRTNQRLSSALATSERTNEALKQAVTQRRIFAALIENSSDFIGIADPEGKPVYLNPAGRRMVGLAPDLPVENTRIAEYYPADQRAFATDVIVKSMVERGHWQGETFLRHWQTQAAIPVSDTHFMIRDPESGHVLGMGTVTRDISDIRRAQVEAEKARRMLQETSEALASLVEQAPDGIFVADLHGRYTEVNSAGCRMLGYTRDELVGKTIVDLIPEERVGHLEREKEQMLAGRVQVSEWTLRRKDASYLPVEVSATILPDGRWQAFVRDISTRKQLERALRASHADLERAQAVAKLGSWRLDTRVGELRWSDENYRIFGVAPGTPMTYDAFMACVHPDDRVYVDREWTAALGGQPYDIEHRIVADGTTKWVRERADLEFDEYGTLVGGIGISQDISDRKQHEQDLREARERFELALRGADLATWDWNIESGEVIFNPRWAEMRGFRPDEVRGNVESWSSGVHPDDWPRVQKTLDDYLQGHSPEYEVELRARTKAGHWIWILDRGKVFARNERGEPIRMVGTEHDITARKRIEEELRLAEAKASGILSISADAIISIDQNQRITLFNEGAEKIFGYSRHEVIGAPIHILVPEGLRAVHSQHVERFAAVGEVARRMGERGTAISGVRKSGEEFPADAAISKLEVDGKKILTVALRDITEQQRLEDEQTFLSELGAALTSTIELQATLTTIGQLATRKLADACIVYVVEDRGEVRRTSAVTRDPGKAWICEALVRVPLDRAGANEIWSELEANRSVLMQHVSPESAVAFAQNEEHLRAIRALDPRSVIMAPLFAHRRLIGAIAFISSAPSRVYGPADVGFAEQVAQRAALAITRAQLYAEARGAIQTRDEVLGIVAHDLRNPLGSIMMQADLLRRLEPEPQRAKKAADSIERAAKRMERLIRDLLDVVRLEQNRLSVEPVGVDVRETVADVVEMQQQLADASALKIQLDLTPDLREVWADRDRLLQILENLIGNAIKFTRAGGVITVGAAPKDDGVLFWVADTGTGIAAEDLPHVFDRFWQAHKDGRRGAGLGLPIVKGLVEAHAGRIWVESTIGRGSTFFFILPTPPQPPQSLPLRHVHH